jgi:hypothetical protein
MDAGTWIWPQHLVNLCSVYDAVSVDCHAPRYELSLPRNLTHSHPTLITDYYTFVLKS